MKKLMILPALLAVGACAMPMMQADLANQCIAELSAEGTFQWNPNDPVPTVIPKQDASQRTADNINRCIREKAGV